MHRLLFTRNKFFQARESSRHSVRLPFPSQVTAKRDRHCTWTKCLHVASPTAKVSLVEGQEWAINNAVDFHLAAKIFILEDKKPVWTLFTPWEKKKKGLSTGKFEWPSRKVGCTMEPRTPIISMHPCSVQETWGICSCITVLSQLLPFGKGGSQEEGVINFVPALKRLFWGKIRFYFFETC